MLRAQVAVLVGVLLVGCGTTPSQPDEKSPADLALPPVAAVADYQLGGAYEPDSAVGVVIRDRSEKPVPGVYSICYVNAFQTQPNESDWWSGRRDLLLQRAGQPVEDEGWPGEYLFDISTKSQRKRLATIVDNWFAGCASDGFDAVEPDNLDSFTRSGGLLDHADAVAFARLLIASAHQHGLAIAQKNTAEIDGAGLGFDFAVAEECAVYDECGDYQQMYGGRVIEIEYTDNGRRAFAESCASSAGKRSILLRDRNVTPAGDPDYVSQHC